MLDALDIKILNILQENGRAKRNYIAEQIGLSIPSLSERLKKLETAGVIQGYFTKVSKHAFGYDIMAFITVVMESSKNYKKLYEHVKNSPEILECHAVLGEGSHILKAIVKNTADLEKLLSKIQSWPGVVRTITSFVLSTIKESTKIKIKE
jgi:Lrp/AsnC family leucine-responsive transcriptional regulator